MTVRISIVTSLFDVAEGGGAARSANLIAHGLSRRGHSVQVISTARAAEDSPSHQGDLEIVHVPPRNLYWIREKNSKPLVVRAIWQILDTWNPVTGVYVEDALQRFRPDVVHVQKLRGLSPSVWNAAKKVGARLVQTCRDYEVMSPEGTLSGRIGAMARGRSPLLRPYQLVRVTASRLVDAVTAPSDFTLESLRQHGFFPRAEPHVVRNSHGASIEQLRRSRGPLRAHTSTPRGLEIVYLGRLEDTKGVSLACKAVVAVNARALAPVHLRVAGWGTQEQELKSTYGGHPNIEFVGPVYDEAKDQFIRSADLMIVPSVWDEVFGNVVVEALAQGVPAIVSSAGGLPELVREGRTGHVVPKRDLDALVWRLERCAVNPYEVRRMREDCLTEAERYSTDTMIGAYEAVYAR